MVSIVLRRIFASLAFVFCHLTFFGQISTADFTGSVEGYVYDSIYKDPLAFALVRSLSSGVMCTTDESGYFHLDNLSPADSLEISYLGYRSLVVLPHQLDTVAQKWYLAPEVRRLDDIVVSASRRAQQVGLAAASVDVVTASNIRERNATTFDQAIEALSGVLVTRASGANVQAVSIRGSSEIAGGGVGNRVLLLIDGRPAISPESGGALWNLVPVHSIERVEVVKGAYSSLYGSSAMGGVINVITQKAEKKVQTKLFAEIGAYEALPENTGYSGLKNFYTLGLNRAGEKGRLSYVFNLSKTANQGHREQTAFDMNSLFSKLKFHLNNQRSIQLSLNYNAVRNDAPSSWLSAFEPYRVAAFRKDDRQHRRETNIDVYYEAYAGAHTKYSSRFYYYHNNSDFFFNADPDNDSTNVNLGTSQIVDEEYIDARRFGNVTQLDWQWSDQHYLIGGVEWLYDLTDGRPDSLLYGRHTAGNLAVYLQDEWNFTPRFSLTLGARFDRYSIFGAFVENNFSPKLSAAYQWPSRHRSRLLLAQAFRNPSIAERYIKYEQGGGIRFLPNPDLQSEQLYFSLELGHKFFITQGLSLDIALFANRYADLISFQRIPTRDGSLLFQVVNLKKAKMDGVELNVRYKLSEGFSAFLSYSYLDARDISPNRINDVLAYKAKHTASAQWSMTKGQWSWHLMARYRSAIEEVFIYPGSEPGEVLLADFNCVRRFGNRYQLALAVKNLTDQKYEELERYRMPGRSFSLSFLAKF